MKNQYFGDINDYRKYGLLRLLSGTGAMRIGVCWMLTPNDHGLDGKKTEYLHKKNASKFERFDSELYRFLRKIVHGHETDERARNVKHFNKKHLHGGSFWLRNLKDEEASRRGYFNGMWDKFTSEKVHLVFFDPDNGLANNNRSKRELKKGHKNSCKKLFRDEVEATLSRNMSVLFYQHFDMNSKHRDQVRRLGEEMANMTDCKRSYSFWTPHTVFFLIPLKKHLKLISSAVKRVTESPWSAERSAPTSKGNDCRQILVDEHPQHK